MAIKKYNGVLAWTTSGILHVATLAVMAATVARIEPLALSIHRGGVTITAVMEPKRDATEEGDWHIHAPGVTQDHHHETSAALLLHRHDAEQTRLQPQRIEITKQNRAYAVTVRPLNAVASESGLPTRVPRSVERPNHIGPRIPKRILPKKLARRTLPAELPTVQEQVPIPVSESVSVDDAGASVDELPQKLPENPAPPYPRDAYSHGQQGRVLLEVRVGADGHVETIRISKSSGVPSLDQAALQTVRSWRFQPARRGGEAVGFTITVPVRFAIRSAE